MNTDIQQQKGLAVNGVPATGFIWIDQRRRRHNVKSMATSHLYNTLRMVWNNTMPVEARVGTVKLYSFGGTHLPEYLMTMCKHALDELERREIPPWMGLELAQMRRYINGVNHNTCIGECNEQPTNRT